MSFRAPDPYETIRLLGRGGMGEVWEVVHRETGAHYALKRILCADAVDELRFQREAQAAALLDSPHVVRVHSLGTSEGSPYLIQELMPGGSLADRLRRGPFDPESARRVAAEIAQGVAEAHLHGVLHRDLKPDNVLFSAAGTAKVADFGLARLQTDVGVRLTATGEVLGTPDYMAPEQAQGSMSCDERSDVYALGAILYVLLTGSPPLRLSGLPVLASLVAIQEQVPEAPSQRQEGVPADLDALCLQALAKDPALRPSSASDFRAALAPQQLTSRRPLIALAAAGLCSIALALLGALAFQQSPPLPAASATATAAAPSPSATPSPTPKAPPQLALAERLEHTPWRLEELTCLEREGSFWIHGKGSLTRWSPLGAKLETIRSATPTTWIARFLVPLAQGGLALTSARMGRIGFWSPSRGLFKSTRFPHATATCSRPQGGLVVGNGSGSVAVFDERGDQLQQVALLGPEGRWAPEGQPTQAMEIRALLQPTPDRLFVVASPTNAQTLSDFDRVKLGWILIVDVAGGLIGDVLSAARVPGGKALAFASASQRLVVGKSVGSIDLFQLQDSGQGRLSELTLLRRNLWSGSGLRDRTTSFHAISLSPQGTYLVAMGGGKIPEQRLLLGCSVVADPAVEPTCRVFPLKTRFPRSLAVSFEARTALVCGPAGYALLVPFHELGLPNE